MSHADGQETGPDDHAGVSDLLTTLEQAVAAARGQPEEGMRSSSDVTDPSKPTPLIGYDVPWKRVTGIWMRAIGLTSFAQTDGERIRAPSAPWPYGLLTVDIWTDPDADEPGLRADLPLAHREDYRAAQWAFGVRGERSNEAVWVLHSPAKFLASARPSLGIVIAAQNGSITVKSPNDAFRLAILRVAERGGDFRTIGAAVAAASDLATIRVADGFYAEELAIDRSLRIEATGHNAWVIGRKGMPVVRTTGASVELVGIGIELAGPAANVAAVEVSAGSLTVERCVVRSASCGILASGSSSILTARDTHLIDAGDTALVYANGASGQAEGNTISECRTVGVMVVGPETAPTIRGNRILGSGVFGMQILNGGSPLIEGNTIEGSAGSGIAFDGLATHAKASGNTIRHPHAHGIEVGHCAHAEISGNLIEAPGHSGVSVYGPTASAKVRSNTISDPRGHGIQVIQGARVVAAENELSRAGVFGVAVGGAGTRVALVRNTIRDAGECGVFVNDAGWAVMDNNDVEAVGSAVLVEGEASRARIAHSRLRTTTPRAPVVLVWRGASAAVFRSQLWGDARLALTVVTGSKLRCGRNALHLDDGKEVEPGALEILNESSLLRPSPGS